MKTRSILFLLILMVAVISSNAQERVVTIKGLVFSKDKSQGALHDVNIYNLKKGWGTTSDINGLFTIKMGIQDTIYFSSIQYAEEKFYISDPKDLIDQSVEIEMSQDTTWLEVVNVLGFPTYEKFKQEILSLDLHSKDLSIAFPVIDRYAQFEGKAGDMELKIPLTYLFKKHLKIFKRTKKKRNKKF